MKGFSFILFLLVLTSCLDKDMSPDAALREFVETRIGATVSREYILEKVTGKMYQSVQNMSEEDYQKFADLKNIQSDTFKIHSKSCQEKRCFITYSLGYKTKEADKAKYQSEVKKIAEMIQVENKWLIADVSNIKTYHESMEPINPLE
jgi:hypothetical protein